MTMNTWKTALVAGVAGIAALIALSGCTATGAVQAEPTTGSTHSAATATPTTEASRASRSTTAPASTDGSSTSGEGSLRSSACSATQLQGSLTVADGGGSAGHQAYELVFRNVGSAPCSLQGWPGVSFVGKGDGTQLGSPATFDRSSPHGTVTIAAGSIAHATLLVANAQDFGTCGATAADGFRVYPPGSKQSLFVDAGQLSLTACSATATQQLQVQAVQPGS